MACRFGIENVWVYSLILVDSERLYIQVCLVSLLGLIADIVMYHYYFYHYHDPELKVGIEKAIRNRGRESERDKEKQVFEFD